MLRSGIGGRGTAAEPKHKYGQQEQVTLRNHNRSTALERSVLKYWGA